VVARWEGALDLDRARAVLDRRYQEEPEASAAEPGDAEAGRGTPGLPAAHHGVH